MFNIICNYKGFVPILFAGVLLQVLKTNITKLIGLTDHPLNRIGEVRMIHSIQDNTSYCYLTFSCLASSFIDQGFHLLETFLTLLTSLFLDLVWYVLQRLIQWEQLVTL